MASTSISQCNALNVSDEKRCEETATSMNGLFCAFHSKQCQGLYRGYKNRNARLDRLSASPPKYLADRKIPLMNQTFDDVDTPELCNELHDHLFLKLQLLERVIRARKLHHSRFFSMNMDYGHQKFLDSLSSQRAIIAKLLERLAHRTSKVLYKNQQWFKWVRRCQDEEEEHREKEQKKVKMEAALFRRHWKAAQTRMKDIKMKEDKKKQDAYLEQLYKERLAEQEPQDDDDNMDWDPIEDMLEDSRGSFVDIIQHFLWIVASEDISKMNRETSGTEVLGSNAEAPNISKGPESLVSSEGSGENIHKDTPSTTSKSSKSAKKKKKALSQTPSQPSTPKPVATCSQIYAKEIPDKGLIETREEVQMRLKLGTEYNHENVVGIMVAGSMENPVIDTKTRSFPDTEIKVLLEEISEIKLLLFCRLLLGHARLLPAALRANSVHTFLADEEVTASDLRDVCLKMERPGLQEIRDACADFFRTEEEDDDIQMGSTDESDDDGDMDVMILKPEHSKGDLPAKWISKREKARRKANEKLGPMPSFNSVLGGSEGTAVDFGETNDNNKLHRKKIRVEICGRTIWNYPSDKAMSRGGWLHFCIIAKDSNLYDAVALCRHWDEFFELNILAIWGYFPGANWAEWVGHRWRQQFLQLGFILYYETAEPDAMTLTVRHQTGGRSSQFRRSHAVLEVRNFMCAHIKRDDQVSRRLIQYLSMQTHELLLLVRDAETGRLLITPPKEERWLLREKSGLGRAAKNDWNVIKRVGPQFFEQMDQYQRWHFSFKEYYDVYVWDLHPGESFPHLYNLVQQMLFKAHRVRKGIDLYNLGAPFLKTLYRDKETNRVHDIKSGAEGVTSCWDDINDGDNTFYYGELRDLSSHIASRRLPKEKDNTFPRHLLYNEADMLEDEILFPEERSLETLNPLAIGKVEPLRIWENEGFSLKRFVRGYWDMDDSDYDDENYSDPDSECMTDDGDSDWDDEESMDGDNGPSADDTISNEVLEAMLKLKVNSPKRKLPADPATDPKAVHDEFMAFIDREKAKIFKEVWHKADLDPNAQSHYLEMMELTKKSRKWNQRNMTNPTTLLILKLLAWLKALPEDSKDLHKAVAKMSPFFHREFLNSKGGLKFKDSGLFNQEERCKQHLDRRSHVSSKYRAEAFWKEFDDGFESEKTLDDLPFEWDCTIRPIIAHLYKSGVIRNRANDYFAGQAATGKEPNHDKYDLFIDYRRMNNEIHMSSEIHDPHSVAPFKATAATFAQKHGPTARFAVLRLWSAPHFYPLMIGSDNENTDSTSFVDLAKRRWIWKFVPKDMPCSEWSIHLTAGRRIMPFEDFFGDRVVVKRDKYLVMGTDENDLFKLACAVTYAVQMRPWRWEIDLWKSFVNVDLAFLEALRDDWLE